ncbi:MAG: hypothetical protein FWG34_00260 [Oscillospiraceae bacterium]|nr:hypothetical protein [Oscillospiraceae bacterium]
MEQIPFAENPDGWICKGTCAVGGFEYFGFSESSDILFTVSVSGRGLIDMSKNGKIAHDGGVTYWESECIG